MCFVPVGCSSIYPALTGCEISVGRRMSSGRTAPSRGMTGTTHWPTMRSVHLPAASMSIPRSVTSDRATPKFSATDAASLLRQCFALYKKKLSDVTRNSLDLATDLFEYNTYVTQDDVMQFKAKRGDWTVRFEQCLDDLFERRMSGAKRKGRRPDFDASLASLRVLTEFD